MKSILWYDRSLRLWTLIWVDQEENQVGQAEYFPNKQEAIDYTLCFHPSC